MHISKKVFSLFFATLLIFVYGWNAAKSSKNMPTPQQLNAICSDIPMYFADDENLFITEIQEQLLSEGRKKTAVLKYKSYLKLFFGHGVNISSHTYYPALSKDERGSISNGKYADFLLVDKDILTCPVTEIHPARPSTTYDM